MGYIKELASSFSSGSVLCMWFCEVCILEGWIIVDAVGWVYVTHLLCEGVGTIVLWDGGGSCLCKRLCCG